MVQVAGRTPLVLPGRAPSTDSGGRSLWVVLPNAARSAKRGNPASALGGCPAGSLSLDGGTFRQAREDRNTSCSASPASAARRKRRRGSAGHWWRWPWPAFAGDHCPGYAAGRVGWRQSLPGRAARRDLDMRRLIAHLQSAVPKNNQSPAHLAIVAVDNAPVVARAVAALATSYASQGNQVVTADLSSGAHLAHLEPRTHVPG